jgi:hypothetical protein
MSAGVELDAGSFPDPGSRGSTATAVLRAFNDRGAQERRAVAAGRLFREATAEGDSWRPRR